MVNVFLNHILEHVMNICVSVWGGRGGGRGLGLGVLVRWTPTACSGDIEPWREMPFIIFVPIDIIAAVFCQNNIMVHATVRKLLMTMINMILAKSKTSAMTMIIVRLCIGYACLVALPRDWSRSPDARLLSVGWTAQGWLNSTTPGKDELNCLRRAELKKHKNGSRYAELLLNDYWAAEGWLSWAGQGLLSNLRMSFRVGSLWRVA